MKTKVLAVVFIVFGFILGIVFVGIVTSISAGEMLAKEFKSPFDFEKTVTVVTERINAQEGWHVTNVIDQNKAVSENGGFPIGNFKIIKYCHGGFSAEMLKDDSRKKIGAMMPKSFAVYEKADGSVYISTMNGALVGKMFGGESERIIEESSLEIENIMRFINLKFTLF